MQEVIYNSKLNLCEYYPTHLFKNLIRVFPRLSTIIPKNIVANTQPILIDKFLFYRMILEKIKSYFEISESFVMSESVNIILGDIRNAYKENVNRIKNEFPIINNKNINKKINNTSGARSPRHYSTNDTNNKRNLNMPKLNKEKKSINKEKLNNKTANVSQINLNLEKIKKSKVKLVHFAHSGVFDNNNYNKYNEFLKKHNVKSFNGFNKKAIQIEMEQQNKTMTNNIQLKEAGEKNKSFMQTNTEYSQRNKSTSNKRPVFDEHKEKNEINLPDMINEKYEKNLKIFINLNIDDKDFNIFDFESKVGKENTLLFIGKYIFNYFKFGEIISQTKYDNWVDKIAKGYNRNNSYHHDLHAADITHTSYIYFRYGLIHEIAKLDTSMICAVIMGGICHDYKHPGVNNNYLIDTNNEIALNYNDISVLENMHISESFKLMYSNPNCNVFEGFDKEKYKKIRKQMIACVLSTDMSRHNLSINFLNKCLSDNNKPEDNDKQDYMDLVIHTADISNPTKIFDIYFKWAKLVVEEFYDQGDKEKELGLKCSCDRTKVTIYKNQLGFIDFIELPFFSLVVKAFPKLDFLMTNLNNNKQKIKLLEEEYNNKNNTKKV